MLYWVHCVFNFLSKKETRHMERGDVSVAIIKLPYCLCRELVVSLELVTAYKALGHQNVHFSIKDQNRFFPLYMLQFSYFAKKFDICYFKFDVLAVTWFIKAKCLHIYTSFLIRNDTFIFEIFGTFQPLSENKNGRYFSNIL